MNGVRVYHAGDTIVFDGMVEELRAIGVDLALLPINGRSYFREQQDLVGNMGPDDAAELADRIGANLVIPMHYDAFAKNRGYPNLLVEIAVRDHPDLQVAVPSRSRTFVYSRPAPSRG